MNIKNCIPIFLVLLALVGFKYQVSEKNRPVVDNLLQLSTQLVANPDFQKVLSSLSSDDFDHTADTLLFSDDDGVAILTKLKSHPVKDIICRRAKNPFNKKTNAWEGGGVPQLRCGIFKKRSDSLWVGTILHEQSHAAGYSHSGNGRANNECTVPNIVGDLATYTIDGGQNLVSLPDDVCPSLRKAVKANE